MEEIDLPEGWRFCCLGDALTLINGRAYKKHEMLNSGYPILRIQNLNGGENWFYSDMELPDEKYCTKGDLLYAWSATFGPYWARWEQRVIYHYHIWKIEPSSLMVKEFAFYELWRITEALKASAHGVAMPHITKGNMEGWEVMLPPLAEQKVIADQLDSLLAQVETTKARLDRIPEILKRFRQSVLVTAVSGRLTEEWRGEEMTINDVCLTSFDGPFGSKLKSSDYTTDGVRVVRLENIRHLFFDESKQTFVSNEKYETLKKNTLQTGDILFSSFVDQEVRVCLFNQTDSIYINKADCFCLRPNLEIVNSMYLAITLASTTSYAQIKNAVQGVTRPRINLKILKGLSFQFPSITKQNEIVRRVEELFSFADSIEQKSQAASERVNKLTQSILAKAFRGELTADWRAANPDLISGENSAEALLKKIKAEREALKLKKKTRAKKVKG